MPIRFPWSRKNKNNTSRKNNNKTPNNKKKNTPPLKRQNASLNLLTPIKKLNKDFIYAVISNNLDKVENLLKEGADINITYSKATDSDNGSITPVLYAASYGYTKLLEFLVDKGADLNLTDSQGNNPLLGATIRDNYANVKFLLDKGANINAKDNDGNTSLMIASRQGYRKIVDLLINKDAKIDEIDNKNNYTALMYATYFSEKDIIKLLLDKGADIDKKNIDGQTALDIARHFGNKKIIQFFSPEMDLSKYPDGGRKKFSEGEENSISYDEYKKGDKVVVITKNGHEFMYLMKSLQDAWNAKGYPYNPSSNEPLKKSEEKNIKRHILI